MSEIDDISGGAGKRIPTFSYEASISPRTIPTLALGWGSGGRGFKSRRPDIEARQAVTLSGFARFRHMRASLSDSFAIGSEGNDEPLVAPTPSPPPAGSAAECLTARPESAEQATPPKRAGPGYAPGLVKDQWW